MKTLQDLQVPATVHRELLEKDVQKQCVDWARARGYWARKFSSMTSTAEPDYLFARKIKDDEMDMEWGLKFATEFKRPGGTSTDAQRDEQANMWYAGWIVFECDNFEKFKKKVLELEAGADA